MPSRSDPERDLKPGQLRILAGEPRDPGEVVGAGFLVDDDHVLTCAHVVNAALGRLAEARERPTQPVAVAFEFPATAAAEPAEVARVGAHRRRRQR